LDYINSCIVAIIKKLQIAITNGGGKKEQTEFK